MDDITYNETLAAGTHHTESIYFEEGYNAAALWSSVTVGDATLTIQHSHDNATWVDDSSSVGGSTGIVNTFSENGFGYIRVKIVCTVESTLSLRVTPFLFGTNGQNDSSNPYYVEQATIPGGENNDLNLFATHFKPTSSATDKGETWSSLSFTNEVIKSSAGALFCGVGYNSSGAVMFLQFFNSATTVSAGAVPFLSIHCPIDSKIELPTTVLGKNGKYFSTGINVAVSTTEKTLTLASAGDISFNANYV